MSIYRNSTLEPGNAPGAEEIPQMYHLSASTHEGKVRPANEDNFAVNGIIGLEEGASRSLCGKGMREPLVCSVFDGTGGAQAGVAASRLAAEYATYLYASYVKSPSDRERLINRFVSECNAKMLETLYSVGGRRGAATFVTAIINNGKLYVYSMGDSRLYLHNGEKMFLVTNDHTIAMEKFRDGQYTREQADRSPERHKLTSFLGIEPATSAYAERYEPIHLKKGDRLMLCSDGLYSMLSDAEISDVIASSEPDKARELIELAVQRGGRDNVTCMVVECE